MVITQKILQKEIDDISIPVYIANFKEYEEISARIYNNKINLKKYHMKNEARSVGEFEEKGSPRIFIYKYEPNWVKLWVLLHEKGHFLCWKNKCFCYGRCPVRCEIHAIEYSLRQLYVKGYDYVLSQYMQEIEKYIRTIIKGDLYYLAYTEVIKQKTWKRYQQHLQRREYVGKERPNKMSLLWRMATSGPLKPRECFDTIRNT